MRWFIWTMVGIYVLAVFQHIRELRRDSSIAPAIALPIEVGILIWAFVLLFT